MVNRKRIFSILSLSVLSAASVPLRADGILEQMQKEVATIATRTRSAVVTIRDDSAVASIHLKWNPTFNQNGVQYEIKRSNDLPAAKGADSDYRVYLKMQGKPSPERSKLEKKRKELLEKEAGKAKSALPADEQKQIDALSAAIQKLDLANMVTVETPSDVVYLPQSGSGFSIGDGYVVTTADVLTGMKAPLVITDNGTRLKAKIVGINNDLNVGLLKLEAKFDLPSLQLGDSAKVEVGHFAISVGNQGGQANSVALMLVGGLRSEGMSAGSHYYPNLIQIAGTVGAGSSGAPLMDAKGNVIGIMAGVPAVQSLASRLETQTNDTFFLPNGNGSLPEAWPRYYINPPKGNANQNSHVPVLGDLPLIRQLFNTNTARLDSGDMLSASSVTSAGFAVPINDIKPILEELKSGKPIVRGWIGIAPKDETTTAEKDGIVTLHRTVTVEGVYPESPAFRAGLQPDDTILRANGKPVQTAAEVRELSLHLRPGDTVTLLVRRSDKEQTLTLHIEARPETFKPVITKPVKEKD